MNEKKEKKEKFLSSLGFILVIVGAILLYPWFLSVDDSGEAVCSNILGSKMDCDS